MRRYSRAVSVLIFSAVVSLFASAQSFAGLKSPPSFTCTAQADGSTQCAGTLVGAAKATGTGDYAIFSTIPVKPNVQAGFSAVYKGKSYLCSFNADDARNLQAAIMSGGPGLYFIVLVKTDGTCGSTIILNGSPFLP